MIVLAPSGTTGGAGPNDCLIEISPRVSPDSQPEHDLSQRSHYQDNRSTQAIVITSMEDLRSL